MREYENCCMRATPEPRRVAAIMQLGDSPLVRALTPVRLLKALTPEPALLDILRQPRTPADNSPSASEGSPSPPTDRTRDPDWRHAGLARGKQVVDHGTPVARRTRRRLQGNLLRNNQFVAVAVCCSCCLLQLWRRKKKSGKVSYVTLGPVSTNCFCLFLQMQFEWKASSLSSTSLSTSSLYICTYAGKVFFK
jgi:hypothetical protein